MTTPEDPISDAKEIGITWHEAMTDLESAGFAHDEAFELISQQWSSYWAIVYHRTYLRPELGQ